MPVLDLGREFVSATAPARGGGGTALTASRAYPAGSVLDLQAGGLAHIVDGWVSEVGTLPTGQRQIFALLLPGDQAVICPERNPQVTFSALTKVAVREVALAAEAASAEGVSQGFADEQLVNALLRQQVARLQDHVVRLGLLSAQARIVHLLLELHDRLDRIGLVRRNVYRSPLTQEILAAMLDLSVVHVNRSLHLLRTSNLLTARSGIVTLHDLGALAAIAGLPPR